MGRGSVRRDVIERLETVVVELTCLRLDLSSLSGPDVVEILECARADLDLLIEWFRNSSIAIPNVPFTLPIKRLQK